MANARLFDCSIEEIMLESNRQQAAELLDSTKPPDNGNHAELDLDY